MSGLKNGNLKKFTRKNLSSFAIFLHIFFSPVWAELSEKQKNIADIYIYIHIYIYVYRSIDFVWAF